MTVCWQTGKKYLGCDGSDQWVTHKPDTTVRIEIWTVPKRNNCCSDWGKAWAEFSSGLVQQYWSDNYPTILGALHSNKIPGKEKCGLMWLMLFLQSSQHFPQFAICLMLHMTLSSTWACKEWWFLVNEGNSSCSCMDGHFQKKKKYFWFINQTWMEEGLKPTTPGYKPAYQQKYGKSI